MDITTRLSTRIFLCMRGGGGGQERKELTGVCNYRGYQVKEKKKSAQGVQAEDKGMKVQRQLAGKFSLPYGWSVFSLLRFSTVWMKPNHKPRGLSALLEVKQLISSFKTLYKNNHINVLPNIWVPWNGQADTRN